MTPANWIRDWNDERWVEFYTSNRDDNIKVGLNLLERMKSPPGIITNEVISWKVIALCHLLDVDGLTEVVKHLRYNLQDRIGYEQAKR